MAGVSIVKTQHIDAGRVRFNFSCQAGEYDRHARVQKQVAARLLQMLPASFPRQGRALEVGTGTGWLAAQFSSACPMATILVSDIAHGMTCRAADRLPRAFAFDAGAEALPVLSSTMDLVYSSSVYQWVNNLPLAFTEARRVLVPGGRFMFALFGAETLRELRNSHRHAAAEIGAKSHVLDFPGEEEIAKGLDAAGFVGRRVFSEMLCEHHASVADLLHGLKRIGARNAGAQRPSGLASRRLMHRMTSHYEERYSLPGGIAATWHVIYGAGEVPR
jgi:malonyl-CoA O-methyltransferase